MMWAGQVWLDRLARLSEEVCKLHSQSDIDDVELIYILFYFFTYSRRFTFTSPQCRTTLPISSFTPGRAIWPTDKYCKN